ncbi:type III secretion system export apparatus subunit SctT [Dyella terrae]|uniref:EscT/YscT/HrcT family type III secretion system export apparatus protein n=2 Tax=Dyella TaxID=231454 RepID=A0A4V2NMK6_9GAMM|nr:type III secretion system export apparatus subunit SctT [Dyella terrae]TBR38732.1 EscT/YscT/HrcT family type III secretion system export apparatus protein [Dyella terrae]TCI13677.1 EscT/YscT/HrcT family type III secretion system export apparatus protein [Dyella soli]
MLAGTLDLAGHHWQLAALAMIRVLACFAWLPCFGTGAMASKVVRSTVALWCVMGLWPALEPLSAPLDLTGMVWAGLREGLVGTALGLALGLPFQVFHGFGAVVNNQRGANIGSTLDPTSGAEATESASLLQWFSVAVFLAGGGIATVLEALRASFLVMGMDGAFRASMPGLTTYAGTVLAAAVKLAAPVIAMLFLVEVLLGMLSRFAQQMNAFSVALAAKTVVAFAVLLVYVMTSLEEMSISLWREHSAFDLLDIRPP